MKLSTLWALVMVLVGLCLVVAGLSNAQQTSEWTDTCFGTYAFTEDGMNMLVELRKDYPLSSGDERKFQWSANARKVPADATDLAKDLNARILKVEDVNNVSMVGRSIVIRRYRNYPWDTGVEAQVLKALETLCRAKEE